VPALSYLSVRGEVQEWCVSEKEEEEEVEDKDKDKDKEKETGDKEE